VHLMMPYHVLSTFVAGRADPQTSRDLRASSVDVRMSSHLAIRGKKWGKQPHRLQPTPT
jgi:hypothetical protein